MRSVTWLNQAANSANAASSSSASRRCPLQHQFTSPASSKPVYSDSFLGNGQRGMYQSTFQSVDSFNADTYHAIDSEESFSNLSLDRAYSHNTIGDAPSPVKHSSRGLKNVVNSKGERSKCPRNSASLNATTSGSVTIPRSITYPKTQSHNAHKSFDRHGTVRQSYSSQLKTAPCHDITFADDDEETSFLQEEIRFSNIHENKVALLAYEADKKKFGDQERQRPSLLQGKSNSLDYESLSTSTGDITSRLVHAIETLRMSVHDNTHAHSKTPRRAKIRRGTTAQMTFKSGGAQNKNDDNVRVRSEKVTVEVRVVFLKIGEIDTLKEYYHADLFTQAKWKEPKLNSYATEELTKIDLDKFWSPLLYIDNILSETKEAQWLTAQRAENGEVYLVERRRIRGVFLETLELNDFPLDVQDLTVTITTERADTEVDLVPDQREMSAINSQTFVDQQEWRLHHHVEITKRIMTQEYSSSMRSQPCISVTCRAARRPGYFYWNVFLIMFMISGLSFATFSVTPDKVEHRLRLSFTLVLTSVTFKYVITQSLPKISYLTYMDKYVLMSLAILCIVSIWHALVTLIPSLLRQSEPQLFNFLAPSGNTSYDSSTPDHLWNDTSVRLMNAAKTGVLFDLPQVDTSRSSDQTQRNSDAAGDSIASSKPKLSTLWQMLYYWRDNKRLYAEGYADDAEEEEDDGAGPEMSSEELEVVKAIEKSVFTSFLAFYALVHVIFAVWLYFGASKRRREMMQKDADYKNRLRFKQLYENGKDFHRRANKM